MINDKKDEDIMSIHSSLLDEKGLREKRKNERFAIIVGIITMVIWGVNGVQVKSFNVLFPELYTVNSCIFWRLMPVTIVSYCICKYKGHRITPHSELKHLKWFLWRNAGAAVAIFLWITTMDYLRISTITVIQGTQPLFIIILSVFILNETFYWRYVIGVIICIVGSIIIVFNDKKPASKAKLRKDNIPLGLFIQVFNIIVNLFANIGQKVLAKEGMDLDEQLFFLALYNIIPSGVICLFQLRFNFNLKYILYVASNGIFFYVGNYLQTMCLKYIAISKFQPITYLCLVFTFIFSYLLIGEPIFFTDIVGSIFIVGFQFYNLKFPPGRNPTNPTEK